MPDHDVLSIGESGTPRWVRPVALLLVVLVIGIGVYRILSAAPDRGSHARAGAEQRPGGFAMGAPLARGTGKTGPGSTARIEEELVTLCGPRVGVSERDIAVTALGRIGRGWLVRLVSKACGGSTGTRTSYGVAEATGRFTPWEDASGAGRPARWRSPDRRLTLRAEGRKVEVRRSSTGDVVATFTTE